MKKKKKSIESLIRKSAKGHHKSTPYIGFIKLSGNLWKVSYIVNEDKFIWKEQPQG